MNVEYGLCTFCHDEITAKWYWKDTERWFHELDCGKQNCVHVFEEHEVGATVLMCKRHLKEALNTLESEP